MIDWLNEITSPSIQFLGVQIGLWRIGESSIAPTFSLVSGPNTWTRRVSSTISRKRNEAPPVIGQPLGDSDVMSLYPLVYSEWIAKGIKSATVDEIVTVTGHSRQRVVYHARKTFARTPKNPEKYTVASVLKLLKTAPAPNGKSGETHPVPPLQSGEISSATTTLNGHHNDQAQEVFEAPVEELALN